MGNGRATEAPERRKVRSQRGGGPSFCLAEMLSGDLAAGRIETAARGSVACSVEGLVKNELLDSGGTLNAESLARDEANGEQTVGMRVERDNSLKKKVVLFLLSEKNICRVEECRACVLLSLGLSGTVRVNVSETICKY